MNVVLSVLRPVHAEEAQRICAELELPLVLTLRARGTASRSTLDLLGIVSRERRVLLTVADRARTKALIRQERQRLYIDAPGNGVVLAVPIKSVGGGKTMAVLSGGENVKGVPELNYDYELILAVVNEGHTDTVMDAARAAGAAGGTVLHGKGTGSRDVAKFFRVSIAQEKEVLLIVSKSGEKAAIMRSILHEAGPGTEAGAVVFSLPVSDVAGFSVMEA